MLNFSRRGALRDTSLLRDRTIVLWDAVPVAQDRSKLLTEFVDEIFSSRNIPLMKAALFAVLIRLDQLRRDVLSGGWGDGLPVHEMLIEDFSRAVGAAIAPRAQVFGREYSEDRMSEIVERVFPHPSRVGKELVHSDQDMVLLAVLLLVLTVELDDWDEIVRVNSDRWVRKEAKRVLGEFLRAAGREA